MKGKSRLFLILGILAVFFNVYAFAIPFERGLAFWVGYAAEMAAIVLQYPIFQSAFRGETAKSKFYGYPLARIGYLYLGVQTVLSMILFPLGFLAQFPGWLSILLCAAVLALALIGAIGTDFARDQVQKTDSSHQQSTSVMADFRSQAAAFPSLTTDSNLKMLLNGLAEDFQFSDPVSGAQTFSVEQELSQMLFSLKEHLVNHTATADEISRIRELLSQRNVICRGAKG